MRGCSGYPTGREDEVFRRVEERFELRRCRPRSMSGTPDGKREDGVSKFDRNFESGRFLPACPKKMPPDGGIYDVVKV